MTVRLLLTLGVSGVVALGAAQVPLAQGPAAARPAPRKAPRRPRAVKAVRLAASFSRPAD